MILRSDSLNIPLKDKSVHCVITSPPYFGLRDYGVYGQIGLESSIDEYIDKMILVFREVWRVLRSDGTLFLNLGDSYATQPGKGDNVPQTKWRANTYPKNAPHRTRLQGGKPTAQNRNGCPCSPGLKPKDLCGIPWRVAFALQADGWYLRSDIIWSKPNPMPESVTDRPTKAHEYLFLLSKSPRYFFDQEGVREPISETSISRLNQDVDSQIGSFRQPGKVNGPMKAVGSVNGRNIRTVWEIATQPFREAHFATFPEELVRKCLLAGCPIGGTVLDPFIGSGTVGVVAQKYNRKWIGLELKMDYCKMAKKRTSNTDVAMI